MKKLFFLLLTLVLGVGMVFAMTNPIHPPGVFDSEVLAEFNVQKDVFVQPTVLVVLKTIDSSFQAVLAYDNFAIRPQYDLSISIPTMICFTCTNNDYHLRC